MNVLPLVSAFILLFAIGSYTFIHQYTAAYLEKKSFSGSMRLEREYLTTLQKKQYLGCPGSIPEEDKRKPSKEPAKPREYISPRDRPNSSPLSKLNLTFLLEKDASDVEPIARDLIDRLYRFTDLDIDSEALLEMLKKTLKEHPSIDTFEELLAHLPKESAPLFYKLIKGTNEYQVSTSIGIPPLGDFFTLDPNSHKRPIHFAYASRTLLQAHFGDILAPQIINEEKYKWEREEKNKHKPLKKEELEALLMQHRKNPPEYIPLLSFITSGKGRDSVRLKDSESHVKLKFTPK